MARAARAELAREMDRIVSKCVIAARTELEGLLRKAITSELADYLHGAPRANGATPAPAARPPRRKSGAVQMRPCIAAGCKEMSKGPRFRYLCDRHRSAPKKRIDKWWSSREDKWERIKSSAEAPAKAT